MAESLGQARLDITVDLEGLEQGLRQARQLIEGQRLNLNVGTNTGTTRSQGRVLTPNVSAARPDSGAIAAERELAAARKQAAAATKQATAADKQRSASSGAISKRFGDAFSSGLIGGAFPLLFGQGAGASLGGLLGGVGGGFAGGGLGFGLSLVGTAIGAQVDQAVQKLQTLATAIQDPIGNFDALKQAALLSSAGIEKNVQSLIEAGRQEEAAAIIRADLTSRFGDTEGATALKEALDQLSRTWAELGVAVASFTAGPLTELITKLNRALQGQLNLSPDERLSIQQQAEAFVGSNTNLAQQVFGQQTTLNFRGQSFTGDAASIRNQIIASLENELLLQKQISQEQQTQQQITVATADAKARSAELASIEAQAIVANAAGDKEMLLLLEKRKLALQEIAALNAAPAGDDVKRDQIKLEFANRRLAVEQQIANLPVSGSLQAVQEQLQTLEQRRLRIDVDSQAFVNASVDIAVVRDQLDQLDGRKAQVEVEVISTGLNNGLLSNSFRNIQRLAEGFRTIAETSPIGSSAFNNAISRYQQANAELRIVSGIIDGTFKNAADAVRQAGQQLRETLEGGFQFLKDAERKRVVERAFREIDFSRIDYRRAGITGDPAFNQTVTINDAEKVIAAAQFQRRLDSATDNYNKTVDAANAVQARIVESNNNLNASIVALTRKDWNVYVTTNPAAPAPALG